MIFKFLFFTTILSVFISCAHKSQPIPNDYKFGEETLNLMDKNEYRLSCPDAKMVTEMILAADREIKANPNIDFSKYDDLPAAINAYETSIENLTKAIEEKAADDEILEKAFDGVGTDIEDLFQVFIFLGSDMITKKELMEYIDVTFCGIKPKKGYKSPLEGDIDK